MAVYIPKFQGFIADAATIDFKRCDGKVYHCDTANATSLTPSANSITVNGGQSQFPIGFIDTDRGLEISFTNAMWDADMFEIANSNIDAVDEDTAVFETKKYAVGTGLKISIPFEVDLNSIYIRGLQKDSAATTSGKFAAANVSSGVGVEITLNSSDAAVGDEIYVSYNRRVANGHVMSVLTNTTTARGAVAIHWPVYSSGTDCTEAAIKGWYHIYVFRARVTAQPDVNTSYKTASTHAITFAAMDPMRADGKMYMSVYEPLTADGAIDTNYTAPSSGTFNYPI